MKQLLKHIIFALAFLSFFCGSAQEFNTKIEGRVYSMSEDVAATHVSNKTQNRGTITDGDGFFNITVRLNDTLVFSAVQFKKKEVVVTLEVLKTKKLVVFLEDALTQLNEVVVMPYNLSGDMSLDMNKLETGPIITASTEKLPNADALTLTQSERKLATATDWDCNCQGSGLDPLLNYFSGRTKMLKKKVARDSKEDLMNQLRKFYTDSLYINDLKIPANKIDDFVYFSERDSIFNAMEATRDKLKLWEFFRRKSLEYRKLNNLD